MVECPGTDSDDIVVVKELHKNFGKKHVLRGLSFEVKKGSIWSLLGPNGSGKTTTLRILSGLLRWDKGYVSLFGKSINPNGDIPHELRRGISYLPEEAGVYDRLTGWENLLFYAMIYSSSLSEAERLAEYGARLSGLGRDIYRRAGEYSKGMKRRLLIARTLMVRPCLTILDEPTSGLDVFSSLSIRDVIRRYSNEGGTVILSSHNMLEVQHLSNEVTFLYKGRIIEKGDPRELIEKYGGPSLEEVYARVVRAREQTESGEAGA